MKVAAGICSYSDTEGLYRCLGSLGLNDKDGIDLAIVIHARFKHFNLDKTSNSLRNTRRVISKFPKDRIKLVNVQGLTTEVNARNLYLKTAAMNKCDWLLVIDSDEFVARKADWKTFREQLDYVMEVQSQFPADIAKHQIFDIQFDGSMPAYKGPRPRLFYRPQTIKYFKKHYWFVLEEQKTPDGYAPIYKGQSDAGRVIGGIYVLHDHTIRDGKYYEASMRYKEWQQEYEGEEIQQQEKEEDPKPRIKLKLEKISVV